MADSVEREIQDLRALFWSERDPEGRAFAPLADAYRRQGDLAQALELLEDGLGRLADFGPGHVVAGWVHRDLGEAARAEEAFAAALALDDENAEALRGVSELAAERGDRTLALDCFQRLVALEPRDIELRARLVETQRMTERVIEAVVEPEVAAATVGAAPEDPWGDPERIRAPIIEVIATEEGIVLAADDLVLEVGEVVEEAPSLEPEAQDEAFPPLSFEPPAATPNPAQAPLVDPEDGPITRTMADLYARQGLHERALRHYRRLQERNPDDLGLAERTAALEALVAAGPAPAPSAPPAIEPPRRPAPDVGVETLARNWAEGPRDTGELSTPFAWTPRPTAAPASPEGLPVRDYFRALLDWEPGEPVAAWTPEPEPEPIAAWTAEPEPASWIATPPSPAEPERPVVAIGTLAPDRVVPIASLAPDEPAVLEAVVQHVSAATPAHIADDPAVASGHRVVPIESLAPDGIVPIESLAPVIVEVGSLAPDGRAPKDDFSSWLNRLQ